MGDGPRELFETSVVPTLAIRGIAEDVRKQLGGTILAQPVVCHLPSPSDGYVFTVFEYL
jgi:2-phospho-L-lactate transferase/gluconeogenesis factor (CofD/UPF0052 family)